MFKKKDLKNMIPVLLVLLLTPIIASGNGLNLNGVGSKAIGMGGAFIGLADDYSAVFWNPAGLTQIKGTSFSVFVIDVIPSASYKLDAYGIDATSVTNHYISGAVAAFFDIGTKLKVGIFGDVPSGLGSEWDGSDLLPFSGTTGTQFEWMSKIGVFHFGPAIAYQLARTVSVGATVNFSYGMMDLKRPVDMLDTSGGSAVPGRDGIMDTQYSEDSKGMGYGFTFGVLYRPSHTFGLGVSFKTRNTVKFSGTAENPTLGLMAAPTTSDFDRDITWPIWVGGGIAIKPMEKLTVTADAQWTQWSANQDVLVTDYKDASWRGALEPVDAHKLNLHWKDKLQIRFGAQYMISESFAVRAGYYNDPAPAPDETVNIILPSITYNVITIGLGWRTGSLQADLSFEYLMGKDRDIAPSTENMPGTHGMNMIVPNIAFTYHLSKQ